PGAGGGGPEGRADRGPRRRERTGARPRGPRAVDRVANGRWLHRRRASGKDAGRAPGVRPRSGRRGHARRLARPRARRLQRLRPGAAGPGPGRSRLPRALARGGRAHAAPARRAPGGAGVAPRHGRRGVGGPQRRGEGVGGRRRQGERPHDRGRAAGRELGDPLSLRARPGAPRPGQRPRRSRPHRGPARPGLGGAHGIGLGPGRRRRRRRLGRAGLDRRAARPGSPGAGQRRLGPGRHRRLARSRGPRAAPGPQRRCPGAAGSGGGRPGPARGARAMNGTGTPRLPRLSRGEAVLAIAMLATLPLVNPYLRGEGNGTYAYVRSLVLDGDLRFDNEYRRGDPSFVSQSFRKADAQPWPPMEMPGGYLRNQWSVGPSLLWLPSFVQAHAAVEVARLLGGEEPADGYSLPYRLACALATAGYAFCGLFLACRAAQRFTAPAPAILATVAVWLASSLPVYVYFLPFYSHALASFAVSVFLWYWLTRRPFGRPRQWAAWGVIGGLVWQMEPLAGLVLVVAVVEWLASLRSLPAAGLPRAAAGAAAFGGATVLAALPQLVI